MRRNAPAHAATLRCAPSHPDGSERFGQRVGDVPVGLAVGHAGMLRHLNRVDDGASPLPFGRSRRFRTANRALPRTRADLATPEIGNLVRQLAERAQQAPGPKRRIVFALARASTVWKCSSAALGARTVARCARLCYASPQYVAAMSEVQCGSGRGPALRPSAHHM